jgi:EmrB/QacA subfamily drug resistance transporter
MTSVADAPPAASDTVPLLGRPIAYKYVVAIVYVTALFLDILDVTIVNVAIPALGQELRSNNAEWVILGYTLSLAVWIPASGWLGDRIGTKRTFMFAFLAFTLGSALCATAQTMGQLIAFRIVQGVGGGMLTPVGVAMLFRAFPPAERARASTIIMLPTMLAPAMGPVLGGLLVTHANWRWIFIVNVPIGIVGILFGMRYLREHREPSAGKFDVPGFLLSGAALAMIVYALSDGPRTGWSSAPVITTATLGIICAILVVRVEMRAERPMLDLRLLHNRIFRQCNVLSLLSTMSFLGLTFVMPLYLQLFRGLDALESGLTTFPQALGILISGQIAGRLYMRVGPRWLMTGGLFAAGLVILLFVRIEDDTNLWLIRVLMLLRGFCMGFAFVPMQAASYATIDPRDNGRASSIFSVQRQVGVSLGVAVLASILATYMPLAFAPTDFARALRGYRLAFAAAVVMAWAAALAAFFVRNSDAAATMRPRAAAKGALA